MSGLRRLSSGRFRVEDARRISEITREDRGRLLPVDTLFADLPSVTLDAAGEAKLRNGNAFPCAAADGRCRFYGSGGSFLAIGAVEGSVGRAEKSFYEVSE